MYTFKREDAFRFMREQGLKAKTVGNELRFYKCPYCKGTSNDKDTFAINLNTGMFKCMRATCGAHGNMITLHKDFGFSLGTEPDEYYDRSKRFRTFPPRPKPEPHSGGTPL